MLSEMNVVRSWDLLRRRVSNDLSLLIASNKPSNSSLIVDAAEPMDSPSPDPRLPSSSPPISTRSATLCSAILTLSDRSSPQIDLQSPHQRIPHNTIRPLVLNTQLSPAPSIPLTVIPSSPHILRLQASPSTKPIDCNGGWLFVHDHSDSGLRGLRVCVPSGYGFFQGEEVAVVV